MSYVQLITRNWGCRMLYMKVYDLHYVELFIYKIKIELRWSSTSIFKIFKNSVGISSYRTFYTLYHKLSEQNKLTLALDFYYKKFSQRVPCRRKFEFRVLHTLTMGLHYVFNKSHIAWFFSVNYVTW